MENGNKLVLFLSELGCGPQKPVIRIIVWMASSLELRLKVARLDFFRGIPPKFERYYVGMSKDMEKRLPQLYYIKMKISYDLGFIANGVAMAT